MPLVQICSMCCVFRTVQGRVLHENCEVCVLGTALMFVTTTEVLFWRAKSWRHNSRGGVSKRIRYSRSLDFMIFSRLCVAVGSRSASREGAGDVSCEGTDSSWMCCIDGKMCVAVFDTWEEFWRLLRSKDLFDAFLVRSCGIHLWVMRTPALLPSTKAGKRTPRLKSSRSKFSFVASGISFRLGAVASLCWLTVVFFLLFFTFFSACLRTTVFVCFLWCQVID